MICVVRSIHTNGRRGGLCDPVDMPICATAAGILSLIFSLIRLKVLIFDIFGIAMVFGDADFGFQNGFFVYYR